MNSVRHRELARNLVKKAITEYRNRFIRYEDLLNGEDRRKVLEEIDDILQQVKLDDRRRLIAERDYYKKQVKELEERLHRVCSLDDCDEEFEL